jgi:hypothetical protein
MLLVAMMVLTNTVSADGSINGVYRAGIELAKQTTGTSKDIQQAQPAPPANTSDHQEQQKPAAKPKENGHNK